MASIGWIPYWNLHPLKVELRRQVGNGMRLVEGHPTDVNRMLGEGQVLCAPASSVALLLNPALEAALPVGVCAEGAVQSVYWAVSGDVSALVEMIRVRLALLRDIVSDAGVGTQAPLRKVAAQIWAEIDALPGIELEHAPHLRLSWMSASGSVLSKLLYRLLFGKAAYEVAQRAMCLKHSGSLELVIGDEALTRRSEFAKVLDLGQIWKGLTGLPFVFAIWQKGAAPLPDEFVSFIYESALATEAKMHIEPSAYFPEVMPLSQDGRDIDLAAYWRCLKYRLDAKAIRGMLLFLCMARPLVRVAMDDAMVLRMMRWQQLGDLHL